MSSSFADIDKFVERGLMLVKLREGTALNSAAAIDSEVTCTVVLSSPIKALLATLEHVFQPVLAASVGAWGAQLPDALRRGCLGCR